MPSSRARSYDVALTCRSVSFVVEDLRHLKVSFHYLRPTGQQFVDRARASIVLRTLVEVEVISRRAGSNAPITGGADQRKVDVLSGLQPPADL